MSISHVKASQLIHADLDVGLSPKDGALLEAHLATCPHCRAEHAAMSRLDEHLKNLLRGHWVHRSVTAAELSKITAKVEAGSKRRFPVLDWGAGWLRSGAQFAAIAGLAALMAWMLGAITGTGAFQPGSETETITPETGTPTESTLTPDVTIALTVEPCAVTTTAPVDVWSGPGTIYTQLGTLDAGTSLLVHGQVVDANQLIWLQVSAESLASGWIAGYSRQGQDILAACPAIPSVSQIPDPPTDTPIPPTETPTPTLDLTILPPTTPVSPTVSPLPTTTVTTVSVEPEYQATVGCSQTVITGSTILDASSVKVAVTEAANLLNQLAAVVVDVGADGRFSATLTYPAQPEGTRLIIAFGEWDGTKFLRPATLFGEDCMG